MWRYTVYDYHHHIPRSQWWSNDRLNLSLGKTEVPCSIPSGIQEYDSWWTI